MNGDFDWTTQRMNDFDWTRTLTHGIATEPGGTAETRVGSTAWHYWEATDYYSTSREFGAAPHHSWDLERDVFAILHRAGALRMPRFTGEAARSGDAKTLRAAAIAALADAASGEVRSHNATCKPLLVTLSLRAPSHDHPSRTKCVTVYLLQILYHVLIPHHSSRPLKSSRANEWTHGPIHGPMMNGSMDQTVRMNDE